MYIDINQLTAIENDDLESEHKPVVLVVDDDESQLTSLSMILKRKYRVIACSDGDDALAKYKAHYTEIKAILTDIRMPRINGFKLCNTIRSIDPLLPVIFITAYQDIYEQNNDIHLEHKAQGIIIKNTDNETKRIIDSLDRVIYEYENQDSGNTFNQHSNNIELALKELNQMLDSQE